MRQYEAMFLFDTTFAANFANVEQEIKRILDRAEAEILLMGKWDERKLAYEIKRHKRGCYVLVYFKASPGSIAGIERDCKLSESVLRVLIVSAEGYNREYMEKQLANRPENRPSEGPDDRRGGDKRRYRRDDHHRRPAPAHAAASTPAAVPAAAPATATESAESSAPGTDGASTPPADAGTGEASQGDKPAEVAADTPSEG